MSKRRSSRSKGPANIYQAGTTPGRVLGYTALAAAIVVLGVIATVRSGEESAPVAIAAITIATLVLVSVSLLYAVRIEVIGSDLHWRAAIGKHRFPVSDLVRIRPYTLTRRLMVIEARRKFPFFIWANPSFERFATVVGHRNPDANIVVLPEPTRSGRRRLFKRNTSGGPTSSR